MEQPERFGMLYTPLGGARMCIVPSGKYVLHSDYCALTAEVERLKAEKLDLLAALKGITERYVSLAEWFWNPEEEKQVIQARAAIVRTEGEK